MRLASLCIQYEQVANTPSTTNSPDKKKKENEEEVKEQVKRRRSSVGARAPPKGWPVRQHRAAVGV